MSSQPRGIPGVDALCRRNATHRIYELVDPGSDPKRALTPEQMAQCGIIANPFIDLPPAERLYLKPVDATASELKKRVHEEHARLPGDRTQPVAFCAWLASNKPLRSITSWLSRRLSIQSPAGKDCLFRFHDPRVMERVEHILTNEQMSALLHPVDSWFFLDYRGALREIELPPHGRRTGPVTLSPDQWRAIKRIGDINRLMETCRGMDLETADASPERIERLLQVAHHYGLRKGDVSTFAMHGLCIREDFHRHPIMQHLLSSVARGRSYASLARALTTSDWDDISTGTGSTPRES